METVAHGQKCRRTVLIVTLPARREKLELTYLLVIWGGLTDYDTAPTRPMIQLSQTEAHLFVQGFPSGSVVKNLPANAEDVGLNLGSGRSPGKANDNPL